MAVSSAESTVWSLSSAITSWKRGKPAYGTPPPSVKQRTMSSSTEPSSAMYCAVTARFSGEAARVSQRACSAAHLERTMERVERLSGDPLQRLLLFVGLLEAETDADAAGEPGCLFASFLYERQLVDEGTRRLIADSMRLWRDRLSAAIRAAAAAHPPVREIDADALADQLLTVVEGAFVLSRALDDPGVVSRQLRQYRDHLELLFVR